MTVFNVVMMAHALVVTDASTSGGWIGWMPANMIPVTIADTPAQRMRFGAVILFLVRSLLFPFIPVGWRLVFMGLSPLSNGSDPCPCCHPAVRLFGLNLRDRK